MLIAFLVAISGGALICYWLMSPAKDGRAARKRSSGGDSFGGDSDGWGFASSSDGSGFSCGSSDSSGGCDGGGGDGGGGGD